MDSEELLAQLADIKLPEAVSWWPPAPGWWALLLLALGLTYLALQAYRRARARKLLLRSALAELQRSALEANDALSQLNAVNSVLRRVALFHYDAHQVAGLSGQSWAEFLRDTDGAPAMSDELFTAFALGRFQRSVSIDENELAEFARHWVNLQYRSATNQEST